MSNNNHNQDNSFINRKITDEFEGKILDGDYSENFKDDNYANYISKLMEFTSNLNPEELLSLQTHSLKIVQYLINVENEVKKIVENFPTVLKSYASKNNIDLMAVVTHERIALAKTSYLQHIGKYVKNNKHISSFSENWFNVFFKSQKQSARNF